MVTLIRVREEKVDLAGILEEHSGPRQANPDKIQWCSSVEILASTDNQYFLDSLTWSHIFCLLSKKQTKTAFEIEMNKADILILLVILY